MTSSEERLQQDLDGTMSPEQRAALKPRPRKSAIAFLAVATAASIAFIAFVLPRPETVDEVFRGRRADGPVAVEPVGEVAGSPGRFVWTRDPEAAHYRLEIYGHEGGRFHVMATQDTFFVPEGLAVPRTGSWRATTIDSVGIGIRSTGQVEFHRP